MSPVVVDAVAPGIAGNVGPAPIPIYGECGVVYDQASERAAAAQRAYLVDAAVRAAAKEREERAHQRSVQDDPKTPTRIAKLASHLIQTRPERAHPLVVEVEIPKKLGKPAQGYAELYRIRPVGSFAVRLKDAESFRQMPIGVTAAGQPVMLTPARPSVQLTANMRWRDPADHGLYFQDDLRLVKILAKLETDVASEPDTIAVPAGDAVPALAGCAVSARALDRIRRLGVRAVAIRSRMRIITDLYGTPDAPNPRIPQNRHTRSEFRRLRRYERKLNKLEARIAALSGENPPR